MMKIKHSLALTLLLLGGQAIASDSFEFNINSFDIYNDGGLFTGPFSASSLNVVKGEDIIRVKEDQGPFDADVSYDMKNIILNGDYFSLGTDLDFEDILKDVDSIKMEKGYFNLNSDLKITGENTNVTLMSGTDIYLNQLEFDCPFDSTTNFCHSSLKTKAKRVIFQSNSMEFLAQEFRLNLDKNGFTMSSPVMNFNGSEKLGVRGFSLKCNISGKLSDIDADKVSQGCLKESSLNIDSLTSDFKKIMLPEKSVVDIDDLNKLRVHIQDSYFKLKGKVKILVNISFILNGKITKSKDQISIAVKKVRIADILPAKDFSMWLLSKFFKRGKVVVKDDVIYIAL